MNNYRIFDKNGDSDSFECLAFGKSFGQSINYHLA